MTTLLSRRTKLPSLVEDFFDSGKLFPDVFDFNSDLLKGGLGFSVPSANIIENDADFRIELAAPGLEKKDFKIELENNYLTISAEKEMEKKEENKNFSRKEFSYNSFSRSFALPDNSIPEKIDAKYTDGILKLTVPKKEVTIVKNKKEIKVG